MANPEHVEIVKAGAEAIRKWRKENPTEPLLLENAELGETDLSNANFGPLLVNEDEDQSVLVPYPSRTGAFLDGANLRNSCLYRANLSWAHLTESNLAGADLREVTLYASQLSRSDLTHALLFESYIADTNLDKVNLSSANLGVTTLANLDLSSVIGLDKVNHSLPSSLGIDTIVRSRGTIPEVFLRGCGVPEIMIEYMQSLTLDENPIQFYKCFISYTEADNDFSERLYNDLQAKGVRCWRWREDAKWGKTLMSEVDQAIRYYDKLIVILSESSLKAEPVIREIERALQKEARERKEVLFPIRVDDAIFEWDHALQADVVRKVVGDFTEWKDTTVYRKALDRLIDCLQAESSAKAAE